MLNEKNQHGHQKTKCIFNSAFALSLLVNTEYRTTSNVPFSIRLFMQLKKTVQVLF